MGQDPVKQKTVSSRRARNWPIEGTEGNRDYFFAATRKVEGYWYSSEIDEDELQAIWESAGDQFIGALLRKISHNSISQAKCLDARELYRLQLKSAYEIWRQDNPDGGVEDFLRTTSLSFSLPDLRGGGKPRKGRNSDALAFATMDYEALLESLRQKVKPVNQYKYANRHRRADARKKDIVDAIQEIPGFNDASEQLGEQLNERVMGPREEIAVEVSAWKHDLKYSYLKRQLPNWRE